MILAGASVKLAYAADKAPVPAIPLAAGLRICIRPTLLGLVPPRDPHGYGELLVRVAQNLPDALRLRYEVKEWVEVPADLEQQAERWPLAADGTEVAGLPLSLPERDGHCTRIRRGRIESRGLAAAPSGLNPLLWGDGDFSTDSSLLWLSRAAFSELKDSESTSFAAGWPDGAAGEGAGELRSYMDELRTAAGLAADAAPQLELTAAGVNYPCYVNGVAVSLPALLARDNLNLANYFILDNPDNPLLLKMSYIPPAEAASLPQPAVATAATEPEAAAAEPARAARSDLLKRQQQWREQRAWDGDDRGSAQDTGEDAQSNQAVDENPTNQLVNADTEAAEAAQGGVQADGFYSAADISAQDLLQLILCGGGYAVTAIDY